MRFPKNTLKFNSQWQPAKPILMGKKMGDND
jgi:hypothetical protein